MGEPGTFDKPLSILLVCYGDYPHYSCRAIDSLARTPDIEASCDIHVGCNACCAQTVACMRRHRDAGRVATLLESSRNLNKDPMLRHLLDLVRTPHVLIMDDDSHVKEGWLEPMMRFLQASGGAFDVAGELYRWDRSTAYQRTAQRRPWWRGLDHVPPQHRQSIVFATGGFLLARAEFLRQHDWPDRHMVVEYEDVVLSDMVHHVGGRLLAMPHALLSCVAINDGERRWTPRNGRADQDNPAAAADPIPPEQLPPLDERAAIRQGIGHFRSGRFREAELACRQVLDRNRDHPEALHLLGMIAHQAGRHEQAVLHIERAIRNRPDVPDFHNNLGNVLVKLDRIEEAEACFRKAIAVKGDYAEGHNNLGNVLARRGNLQQAAEAYQKAIALKPAYQEAHANLANVYVKLGQGADANGYSQRALQAGASSADALNTLAVTHQDQGQLDEAMAVLERAIALRPEDPHLQLNKAMMLLLTGDLERGWKQYEWRWRQPENPDSNRFQEPAWEGEDLGSKTILIHCEQGLGATMQFIRYVPMLLERAGRVIVECQPPLKTLLRLSLPRSIELVSRGEPIPAFDLHSPLLSLPRLFGTVLQTIPAPVPYLMADGDLVRRWQGELAQQSGFKVGIAWQGNPAYKGDRKRSIPLKHFQPLSQVQDVRLFGLQKNIGGDQVAAMAGAMQITDLGPRLDEKAGAFMDTAAVTASLDLVITSDTSIAHLAGAMGRPVWVALCQVPDWRWMLHREDSPWYPGVMRLFRQERPGDWEGVFGRLAEALRREVARRRSCAR